MDAELSRLVVRGGDDAPSGLPPHDDTPALQSRIVKLLNGGIEGIHVYMENHMIKAGLSYGDLPGPFPPDGTATINLFPAMVYVNLEVWLGGNEVDGLGALSQERAPGWS